MREDKFSLNKLSKRYPLPCKLNFSLSIFTLFFTFLFDRLTVWWSSDLCNQRERGVEPLRTKFRNTLFILLVPLSNRWRFIFNIIILSNVMSFRFFLLVLLLGITANAAAALRSGGSTPPQFGHRPKVIPSTKIRASTSAAISQNRLLAVSAFCSFLLDRFILLIRICLEIINKGYI